ncbi:MAG: citrulline utilization hydrolase CtlX [Gammaproteobacteria bacterium]
MWQTTDAVLMVRPAAFGSNPETLDSNAFQHPPDAPRAEIAKQALVEFDGVVEVLRAAGVRVCIVDDESEPRRPDAVFPNNWLSTHESGTVVLYPMEAPSRRNEVRHEVVEALRTQFHYRVERVLDMTPWSSKGMHLEGTGSMVLDRVSRTAFACLSARTSVELLSEFCHELDYAPFAFQASDADGVPIYHTNVMMWVGTQAAAVCLDAVENAAEREKLATRLAHGGRTVLELSRDQMAAFAGNALELRSTDTHPVIAMSSRAAAALTDAQRHVLEAYARLAVSDIGTIETYSGGSVRCMLAEIFLPR